MSDKTTQEWQIDNLPNRLTIFRMFLVPVIIVSLGILTLDFPWAHKHQKFFNYLSGWLFIIASVTDFLDGYIARKKNLTTVFGSFLDPIADKFLVVSALILLQELDRIPMILVIILVLRELYITALRLLAKERGITVAVNNLGKLKTTLQMVSIPMLMANDRPWGIPYPELGLIFMSLAAITSLYSSFQYSFKLLNKLKEKRRSSIKNKERPKEQENENLDQTI